jgi:hypothetical protein
MQVYFLQEKDEQPRQAFFEPHRGLRVAISKFALQWSCLCCLPEQVYFLREEEEQPRQAFLTPTGDYVERRAPGFVARYFLHYVIPYRCLALGDTWEDPHHHTHDLVRAHCPERNFKSMRVAP